MAYIQKTIPPPNKILDFSLQTFTGGLNNRTDQLLDNEASDLVNMCFADDTLMERRKGVDFFDDTAIDSPIYTISEFKPYTEDDQLIKASDTKIYFPDMEFEIAGQIQGVNFNGRYFFVDGEHLYVYGKFPQVEGTYTKIIGTPVNENIIMKVIDPPNNYTPLGTEHVEGITRYNYTNRTVHYEPCQHEMEDTYKGTNVLPDNPKYIVSHKGRVFISGSDKDDDNVFISDVRNPFYYPVYLPIQLPPNSDKVVGLTVFDDAVIIGRNNDIYAIQGNTNRYDVGTRVFELRKLNTHTGFANQNAVSLAHDYLFFLGSDGNAYALTAVNMEERVLSTRLISKQLDLFKYPLNFTHDDLKNAKSIFYKDEWYVSINDKILVYSYRHRAWTLYTGWNASSFYILNGELIFGTYTGYIGTPSNDYYDFGEPYRSFWRSKWFDMNHANNYKQFKEFFIVAHVYDDKTSGVDLTFEIDYANVKEHYSIRDSMARWGKSRWGDRFINRNIVTSLPLVLGRRGRVIRFTLSNGYEPSGTVEKYGDLQSVPEKRNGMLIKVLDEDNYYIYYKGSWYIMLEDDLNQAMKIYQVNGTYELRGKR